MGSKLILPAETLSGAGSAQAEFRLAQYAGRTYTLQIDTDGTLLTGAVTIEVRNKHADAVGGGGWVDYTAELTPVGDDLTAAQGSRIYNFSFLGAEECRLTIPWGSGAGDVSATLHAVP